MSTIRALLVPAHGDPEVVHLARHWRGLTTAIDAQYVERVRTPIEGVAMWVDEDGIAKKLQENCWVAGRNRLYPGDIYGDVLITGEEMTPDGLDVAGLTDEQLIAVLARIDVSPKHLPDLMSGIEVRS